MPQDRTFTRITIEPRGRGETYRYPDGYTVYGHDTYPRSSVLEGQPRRTFLGHYDTLDQAKQAWPTGEAIEGSTYESTRPDLSHLPDEGGDL